MAKSRTALVIVESPAKARTIEKYLGSGYKVVASMGHLRDLPKSTLGVDIEGGFIPEYVPVKDRADIIDELKRRARSAEFIYLATDPDREGEAISWHLKELLELPDEKTQRVTFNEITKRVVTDSIAKPRALDMDLVDAQQARRILDRIVGYKLSPLLWKKVRRGLSAGRVQSVATRMAVDREREIRAFVPEEYWHLDAELGRIEKPGCFKARYHGDGEKKRELHTEEEVETIKAEVEKSPFEIVSVCRGEKQRSPSPPFITSTLQQEASRRLGMTPRRTMSVAQQLYEGVDIEGEGTVGLITYMRTDSLRISDEALAAARSLIESRYGSEYYYGKPRVFKTRAGAQDAHEAIRPSIVTLTPDRVKKDLTREQYMLYRLIWGRFTASQMANAVYDTMSIDAVSAGHVFRANHSSLRFSGYTAVYEDRSDDEEGIRKPLPDLHEGEIVELQKISAEQQFTQPPARYTEATLIRAMEEKGIGRPSTYAPTISTITAREYVVKEGRNLRPTALGEVITELMEQRFPDIVDLKFTARMEQSLDEIEAGKVSWRGVLNEFYDSFAGELTAAEQALDGTRIKVPDEVSEEVCDICGRHMVVKSGRFGRFLACPGYPECTFTKPLVVEMPGKCPVCGARILKRTSRNGYTFYACENGSRTELVTDEKTAEVTEVRKCGFMSWDVPVKETCPSCGKTMFKLSGRGARKPFCINPDCEAFVPEDKRGHKKKAPTAESAPAVDKQEEKETAKKTTSAKSAAKKAGAAKTTKKSAEKKTTTTRKRTAKTPEGEKK
ncbi:MAG: type I DNA topoisomerase [Eubacteriales bacterium]|nr:type I DNA topoisomerase [Eubacteriales bacterium]